MELSVVDLFQPPLKPAEIAFAWGCSTRPGAYPSAGATASMVLTMSR